jgi:hypothetical protein
MKLANPKRRKEERMQRRELKRIMGWSLMAGLVCALFLAAPQSAQAADPENVPEQVYTEEIERQDLGDAEYLTGGVGLGERNFLDRVVEKGEYDLKLVFAVKEGAYLSDIIVEIRDNQGELLVNAVSKGPWFFVELDPGVYKISATYADVRQTKKVQVPGRGMKEASFLWKR